ncbi:MAG: hypothetical protein H6744_01890 [Deltaproteobacteria bacterium]|nr:hypothetical protein [Deltaproteobacteria bacterium]MCB9785420.1 hypothetical protein [Deltaproteobacteria bacterium]
MSSPTKTTTTETRRATTRTELRKALRKADLTVAEEQLVRMRLGLSEPPSAKLVFRGQDDAELATKLATLEADALRRLRPPAVVQAPLEGNALKRAIIDELKKF